MRLEIEEDTWYKEWDVKFLSVVRRSEEKCTEILSGNIPHTHPKSKQQYHYLTRI